MSIAVLDSSAFLALVYGETGGEIVAERCRNGLMSTVNYSEVLTKQVERSQLGGAVTRYAKFLEIAIVDFDRELAEATAQLRRITRDRGLSFGDRACLALAIREKGYVLTADQAWKGLDVGCDIEMIR
ncbi:type II toxin-antitoxin system VapC family toxin [Phyllobacterium sp. 628]|uniref:type II toxin-antitoxin system VapC family toxin n=1 Tax=Phyllobacterium sp. 628 TaxID=2718938 RepID=UPI00166222A8|nr:type II toxin-antitoxin system VapC family toxin [Phyllobacterium sp. 628]QND52433.1 type II toxin-antitoxin system VapC family toxin [Phyllobacterium sp. 628]